MSAESTQPQAQKTDATDTRSPAEKWLEQVGSHWGRCLILAWRTVFPPREDYR